MAPSQPPPDHEFASLRKLLTLKRFEVPPPGYLERFSGQVIARLGAEDVVPTQPWWDKLLSAIVVRPSLAGAVGLFASALLVVWIGVSKPMAGPPEPYGLLPDGAPVMVQAALLDWQVIDRTGLALELPARETSSVSPVVGRASPFSAARLGTAEVLPASYRP